MIPSEYRSLRASTCWPADVLRFQIAVNDVLAMRRAETAHNLLENPENAIRRERAARVNELLEAFAAHQLHRDVERPVLRLAQIVDVHDVRMIQTRHCTGFLLEAAHHVRRGDKLRFDQFDRNRAVQHEMRSSIHRAHSALAQERIEAVFPFEHGGDWTRFARFLRFEHAAVVRTQTLASGERGAANGTSAGHNAAILTHANLFSASGMTLSESPCSTSTGARVRDIQRAVGNS